MKEITARPDEGWNKREKQLNENSIGDWITSWSRFSFVFLLLSSLILELKAFMKREVIHLVKRPYDGSSPDWMLLTSSFLWAFNLSGGHDPSGLVGGWQKVHDHDSDAVHQEIKKERTASLESCIWMNFLFPFHLPFSQPFLFGINKFGREDSSFVSDRLMAASSCWSLTELSGQTWFQS